MDTSKSLDRVGRLKGYLRATCKRNREGQCYLSDRDYRVPIHISKPYWDGSTLLLNVMSPTAGMLADDHVSVNVSVKENAALVLSNPSSLRIHKMDPEHEASWSQTFQVDSGALLECNPEWLILQGESAFKQTTQIEVSRGGQLFFIEAIAPGRIAHGESFQFRSFRNELRLQYDGRLAALERQRIEPKRKTHLGWSSPFAKDAFYVSIFIVSEKLDADSAFWKTIYERQTPSLKIGASALARPNCWNVKLLSDDPVLARATIAAVREDFYLHIKHPCPRLRRQ